MASVQYNRILLKMGGEALAGPQGFGIDPTRATQVAQIVKDVYDLGVQVALVIGGGNLWRGSVGSAMGMERASADHIGMIATVMNALTLQDALERVGIITRVQTAIEMRTIAEPYIRLRAIRHLEKGRVVVCAGGTGNPFFTTDTAAALRAIEVGADIVLKATKVDGVYSSDPAKDTRATLYQALDYDRVIENKLGVMDANAIVLCRDQGMPIRVFNVYEEGNLMRIVRGEPIGTLVS